MSTTWKRSLVEHETEFNVEQEWQKRFAEYATGRATNASYRQVKAVCQNCGVHFLVATWFDNRHSAKTLFCPECGIRGKKIVWAETVQGFIFQTIPGKAKLVEMKNDTTVGVSFVQGRRRVFEVIFWVRRMYATQTKTINDKGTGKAGC